MEESMKFKKYGIYVVAIVLGISYGAAQINQRNKVEKEVEKQGDVLVIPTAVFK